MMAEAYHEKTIDQMKLTRMMMFTMVRLHGDPNKSPSTPETFWPLPGDMTTEQMTAEEIDDIKRRFAELKANG